MSVLFVNESEMELNALMFVGLHAKPLTTSPIGHFGSGLKYAIAVLLRHGAKITIITGTTTVRFITSAMQFRGTDQTVISMQYKNSKRLWGKTVNLPFTLAYGKNWTLWQAYRELESNVRDELGHSEFIFEEDIPSSFVSGGTKILIEHPDFDEVYAHRDEIFLPPDEEPWYEDTYVQVFRRPSKHIYYRGLRVYDFPEKETSLFTYNFKVQLELTEDRTVKWPYYIQYYIVQMIMASDNAEFIKAVFYSKSEEVFETNLNYHESGAIGGDTFRRLTMELRHSTHVNHRVNSYYSSYISPPPPPKDPWEGLKEKFQWWIDSGEIDGHTELKELLSETIDYVEKLKEG